VTGKALFMASEPKSLGSKGLGKNALVLIVEDERDLAEMLAFNLQKEGYRTVVAHDGRTGLRKAAEEHPNIILLDLMLPQMGGTEVAARIRTDPATANTPIIMVTAKADEIDQLVGLGVGADDYITKPFSIKVLLARMDALLRRATPASPAPTEGVLRLGGVRIDLPTHQVTVDEQEVRLTLTEFRLLAALVQASGRVLTRQHLMSRAMGPGITVTERTIDVHMTAIRRKLGPYGSCIVTVRGVGYRADPRGEVSSV
jgi:two-component system phosphate regulon response regulator PhoB